MTTLQDLRNKLKTLTNEWYYLKKETSDLIDSKLNSFSSNLINTYQTKNIGVGYANKNVVTDSNGVITTENKPTIPSKISDLTNDSNFIETSNTTGLIKNDGTIDTNTYLTTHQDITGKVNITDIKDNLTSTDSDKPLSAKQGKILNEAIGSKTISIEKQATAENGFTATYVIKQNGTALSPKINIPKDFLLKSASLETVGATPTAIETENNLSSGDKYLKFIVNTQENDNITTLLIPVNDLIDTYTGDNSTIVLNNNNSFSVKNNVFADKNHTHSNYVLTTDSRLSDAREPTEHYHSLSDIDSTSEYGINVWRDLYEVITLFNDKLAYYDNTGVISYRSSDGYEEELANLHNIQDNIVDNLTTNDATKSLSAKQGKILNDKIGDILTIINGTGGGS